MREKLTIEQFRQIREQINHVVSQLVSQETDDTNKENKLIYKYLELQNKILSYDLSDIPFEEWNNFIILSDNEHFADFSQTKANIDFDLVSFDAGFGNFKGCNLRNVEKAHRKIFTLFDNDFIKKYYNYSLTIADLTNLSKEQFEELNMSDHYDYRDLYSHLENSFVYVPLFNNLEFEKAMELYKYSKEDFNDVAKIISLIESRRDAIFQYDGTESFMKEINNLEVQNLKRYSFDYCKTAIKNGRYHINGHSLQSK